MDEEEFSQEEMLEMGEAANRWTDRNKRSPPCFKCGKSGHWSRECPELIGKRNFAPPNAENKVKDLESEVDQLSKKMDKVLQTLGELLPKPKPQVQGN